MNVFVKMGFGGAKLGKLWTQKAELVIYWSLVCIEDMRSTFTQLPYL